MRDLLLEEFAAFITAAMTTTIYVTRNLADGVRLDHQIAVLSRGPGEVKALLRADRPLVERTPANPDMMELE